MKQPQDKWSRDFSALLEQQAKDLQFWAQKLRPEVYADLERYVRSVNRAVSPETLESRAALQAYKAGGIHVCPVGLELYQILLDRTRFEESVQYVLRSDVAVVAEAKEAASLKTKTHTMKEIAKKIAAIATLFTELSELFDAVPEGGGSASGGSAEASPLEQLQELAGKKDPKLVTKVLAKFGAEYNDGVITDLDEDSIEKATAKIEALDDVEGGTDEPEAAKPAKAAKAKGGSVDLEKLREVAQELITDGKSSAIKKVLDGFKAPSLSKLDEKHYDAVFAKLNDLKD